MNAEESMNAHKDLTLSAFLGGQSPGAGEDPLRSRVFGSCSSHRFCSKQSSYWTAWELSLPFDGSCRGPVLTVALRHLARSAAPGARPSRRPPDLQSPGRVT